MVKNFRDWVCESLESFEEERDAKIEEMQNEIIEEDCLTDVEDVSYVEDDDYDDWGYYNDGDDDWRDDYRDAFEDDPEACWGREW